MRLLILSSVTGQVTDDRSIQYFSTLCHTGNDLREKVIEHEMCFDFLYIICLKHFSFYKKIQRYKVINAQRSSSKVAIIFVILKKN
jgi:hypothetical protein